MQSESALGCLKTKTNESEILERAISALSRALKWSADASTCILQQAASTLESPAVPSAMASPEHAHAVTKAYQHLEEEVPGIQEFISVAGVPL